MGKKNGHTSKLTDQQLSFVAELLASDSFNVSEAARKAGYSHPAQSGYRLLQKPHVRAAIEAAQKERSERCQIRADEVLVILRDLFKTTPASMFDGDWNIKSPEDIPEPIANLIEGIEVDGVGESRAVKVKSVSKTKALELLMQHLGMIGPAKHQHEIKHTLDWDSVLEPPKRKTIEDRIDELAEDEDPANQ